ncbi:MAG: GNAT family N-acetyltransferase [Saprospiraceae bacterium]
MEKNTPDIRIEKCGPDDLLKLRDLAIRTFVDTYAIHNTEEVMADYLQQAFNKQQLQRELSHPESEFYVLICGPDWVGYIKLNEGSAQTENQGGEAMEIERIYVDNRFHGQGLGKMMIVKALAVAREKNKERIWLGVWEHNPRAIRFYQGQGFEKTGTHVFRIGGEDQIDWVMEIEV